MIRCIAAPALAALTLAASAAMPLAAGAAPKDVVAVAEKRAASFSDTCVDLNTISLCLLEILILDQQAKEFIGRFTP